MIDVADAYKKSEDGNEPVLEFKCEYCNRTINEYGFNLSVFLYGAVILGGREAGYIGVSCPNCLYTVLLKCPKLSILQQKMDGFYGPNGILLHPQYNYHSSILYSPSQIEGLDSFNFQFWNSPINRPPKEQFNSEINAFVVENNLEQDYLCSYDTGGDAPIGVFASVWWYRPDDIEKLAQIENDHRVRVFPRYVHKMNWCERYDYLCWRYRIYLDYLYSLKETAASIEYQLREYAYQQDINLDRLIEADPEISTVSKIEFMEECAQEVLSNDIQVASEFLDLIVNFNPDPWDVPGKMSGFYKGIWKAVKPFRGASFPADVKDIDLGQYRPAVSDTEVKEMTDRIRSYITKSHVQEWAVENHQGFIDDYISLACRPGFSYGDVWDLKCRYLKKLHEICWHEHITIVQYGFFDENGSWRIIFKGKPISNLTGTGFKYIEFLMKNSKKQYHTDQLNELDEKANKDGKFLEKNEIAEMKGVDIHVKTDSRAKRELKARIDELQEIMTESENCDDIKAYKKAEEEYESILSHLRKDFTITGKPRYFRDDSNKIKDRIVQAIRRAIQSIKKHDPVIAKHFDDALKPINSFQQCYKPLEDIKWQFKA